MLADTQKPNRSLAADALHAYRLRWRRRRFLYRVLRKRSELTCVINRNASADRSAIFAFSTVRNELLRLPFFLKHYRRLGVQHFFFVDNDSTDGTLAFLREQPDVSLWSTAHSYRLSRFGVDWLGWLQLRFGHGHWCLTVDADELLIYPFHDSRSLTDLTAHLDQRGIRSFGTLMVDLFPKGPLGHHIYQSGQDPLQVLPWFDAANYRSQWHSVYDNLWIQGGVRDRVFFSKETNRAPTLNKTPLIRWNRRFAYVNSTHQVLPRWLGDVFGTADKPKLSGVLLHTKFLNSVIEKSKEDLERRQHFENSDLYTKYYQALVQNPDLWDATAQRFTNWQKMVELGLMSKGTWV